MSFEARIDRIGAQLRPRWRERWLLQVVAVLGTVSLLCASTVVGLWAEDAWVRQAVRTDGSSCATAPHHRDCAISRPPLLGALPTPAQYYDALTTAPPPNLVAQIPADPARSRMPAEAWHAELVALSEQRAWAAELRPEHASWTRPNLLAADDATREAVLAYTQRLRLLWKDAYRSPFRPITPAYRPWWLTGALIGTCLVLLVASMLLARRVWAAGAPVEIGVDGWRLRLDGREFKLAAVRAIGRRDRVLLVLMTDGTLVEGREVHGEAFEELVAVVEALAPLAHAEAEHDQVAERRIRRAHAILAGRA